MANGLRAVIGVQAVARLEDFAYGLEDRVNRFRHHGERPQARWAVPTTGQHPIATTTPASNGVSPFVLNNLGPVRASWSAPGDGAWLELEDPLHADSPVALRKTLLHPDANRSWAELFVVAIDLRQVALHAVAGTREPKAEGLKEPLPERPGTIPAEAQAQLVAAFNGGFMAEHGHYGMRVAGLTLLAPRDTSCTVIGYGDGSLEISTWKKAAHALDRMTFFRQTPACMYEDGVMHVGLRHPETRAWGATLDGDTVIRRSGIGLDESRQILFVGIGNHLTALALAEGLHHAGATDVAQLDVNWSYPKFITYERNLDGSLKAKALADGFEFSPDEYVRKRAYRDFFYLARRPQSLPGRAQKD